MSRTKTKLLLIGLLAVAALIVSTSDANAFWGRRACCGYSCYTPVSCYSCYSPCSTGYSPCSTCYSPCSTWGRYGYSRYWGYTNYRPYRYRYASYRYGCNSCYTPACNTCTTGCNTCSTSCDPCGSSCSSCTTSCNPCSTSCNSCSSCTSCDPCSSSACNPCSYTTSDSSSSCCQPADDSSSDQNQPTNAPAPGNMDEDSSAGPPSAAAPTYENSGQLTIWAPAKAKITINGYETTSKGSKRRYVSTGLQPGLTYKYVIRAELPRNGKMAEETKTVYLTAGSTEGVAFGFNRKPISALAAAQ